MKNLTTAEFDEAIKEGYTLVDFYADWCGPCKALAPVLDELEEERKDITFVRVNVDDEPDLAVRFGIMSIPIVYLFKDSKPIGYNLGFKNKDGMTAFINNSINTAE